MARIATIVDRKTSALTETEKARKKGVTVVANTIRSTDKAGWSAFVAEVNAADAVFSQTGDMIGKRVSGAKSHDFADQTAAYVDTVLRGMLPKIA